MAANQNDYFTKSVRKFSTTLGAGGLADATSTSGAFQSTTNLPTDTAIYFTVDRVDANGTKTPDKEESCIGVVSGSNVTSLLRGVEGTAQAHSAGAVVECRLLAHQWNRITEGILVGHNQDGTHKTTAVVTPTGTQTLTNKTITKRVSTIASSATPTPNADTTDIFTVTALGEAATFAVPSGTPVNGQTLLLRIIDNGTARALDFNAIYRFSTDLAKPTTTVLGKTLYMILIFNSAATKWDCLDWRTNF